MYLGLHKPFHMKINNLQYPINQLFKLNNSFIYTPVAIFKTLISNPAQATGGPFQIIFFAWVILGGFK